jgi:predicted AAA+ superfamily ATPase
MFGEAKGATYCDLEFRPGIGGLRNPELALGDLKGLVILDEIQELPGLFRALRVLLDRQGLACRLLVQGSAMGLRPDSMKLLGFADPRGSLWRTLDLITRG